MIITVSHSGIRFNRGTKCKNDAKNNKKCLILPHNIFCLSVLLYSLLLSKAPPPKSIKHKMMVTSFNLGLDTTCYTLQPIPKHILCKSPAKVLNNVYIHNLWHIIFKKPAELDYIFHNCGFKSLIKLLTVFDLKGLP